MLRYLENVVTLQFDEEKCRGCGLCESVCPQAVFVIGTNRAHMVDRDACIECGACARNCSAGAISVRAGVGCAAAVLNSKLKGTATICC